MSNENTDTNRDRPTKPFAEPSGSVTGEVDAALLWVEGDSDEQELRKSVPAYDDAAYDCAVVLAREVRNLRDALERISITTLYEGFDDYNARRVCGNIARQHCVSQNDKLTNGGRTHE